MVATRQLRPSQLLMAARRRGDLGMRNDRDRRGDRSAEGEAVRLGAGVEVLDLDETLADGA
jgi:hypothetical protein